MYQEEQQQERYKSSAKKQATKIIIAMLVSIIFLNLNFVINSKQVELV